MTSQVGCRAMLDPQHAADRERAPAHGPSVAEGAAGALQAARRRSRTPSTRDQDGAEQDRDAGDQRDLEPERLREEAQQVRVGPELPGPGREEDGVEGGEGRVEGDGEEDAQQRRPPCRCPAAAATIAPSPAERLAAQPPADRRSGSPAPARRPGSGRAPRRRRRACGCAPPHPGSGCAPSMLTREVAAQQQVAEHRGGGAVDRRPGRCPAAPARRGATARSDTNGGTKSSSGPVSSDGGGHGQAEQQHQPGRGTARRHRFGTADASVSRRPG